MDTPAEFKIDPTKLYPPDFKHMYVFMTIMVFSGMAQNYIDYSAAAETLYDVQYKWDDQQSTINQTWIASTIILGATIGAFTGGKIMQNGRRMAHFWICGVGIAGVGITMAEDFEMQLVGRFFYGYAAGFQSVASPRFIEEYVPAGYEHTCIAIYTLA